MSPYKSLTLLILVLLTGSFALGWYWNLQTQQPLNAKSSQKVTVIIQRGESAHHVSQKLAQKRLIRSPFFFLLYLKLRNSSGTHLQAGRYELSPSMSTAQIVETISKGGSFEEKITFPEGWRVEQMSIKISEQVLDPRFQLDAQEFLKLGRQQRGYLFPDTYFIDQNTTAKDLIAKMRTNFNQKYAPLAQAIRKQGLSPSEAVTLASIVEREAVHQEDRQKIAGILIKRWKHNWPLDADATVQFALANLNCKIAASPPPLSSLKECDWWPQKLTPEDLKIDSPYNTRLHPGLPPTPIGNPGLAALEAVAHPQETPYWYYLTDKNGVTHYATTLEEHNANIVRYLNLTP